MASSEILRHCPVCGHVEARAWLETNAVRLVCCGRCGMVYANPVAAQFASGQYYDEAGADYYLSPAKLESDYAPVRFERELRLFRRHCSGGSVLDVGCSSGAFLYQLKSRFPGAYEVLGTDISGPPLDYAESRGVAVRRGNFLEQDFSGTKFDAVTFWAVIEHLLEPKQFLERAWSVLKPNGLCFVLAPNLDSLAARLLGSRYRYIYPQHLNYFNRTTLMKMVEPRFALLELRSTHFNPIVIWQDWRRGGEQISNAKRGELLARTTAWKQAPLMGPAKALYKVAEKSLGALNLADNLAAVLGRKE